MQPRRQSYPRVKTSIIPIYIILLIVGLNCSSPGNKVRSRLANVSSTYLRDHADNPVEWYEWGDEALARAKTENKPLLISIGYSSCHWCHTMERESFMDPGTADIMNENFICIKVDREERPDIDNIYVRACQLLNNGDAGWPLNAFALPDGKPFFAGTYYARENWKSLLLQIAESYKTKHNKVMLQANALTFDMIDRDSLMLIGREKQVDAKPGLYKELFQAIYNKIDSVNGGLRGQSKFPTPSLWEFLLQYHYLTGNKQAVDITANTMIKMARGGINDHIGGGFARYATDSSWRIPHFEKMLYDNAQLISVYAHLFQVTKNELFRQGAQDIMKFIERDLQAPDGSYYSSVSADGEGGEGKFYTWSYAELRKILNARNVDLIASYYNMREEGNLENGRNILYTTRHQIDFAADNGLTPKVFSHLLEESNKKLFAERNTRSRPRVDKKVITSWNALLLKAYADAYAAFDSPPMLEKAVAIAKVLEKNMIDEHGRLWRNFTHGKTSTDAFLDDYAFLAKGLIRLYEVSFDKQWIGLAEKVTAYAVENFYDERTGYFFYVPLNTTSLIFRKIELLDNVFPSANPVMGEVLLFLGRLLENQDYLDKTALMFSKMAGNLKELLAYSPQWGTLAGLMTQNSYEVAIMGPGAIAKNRELQKSYLPNCMFIGGVEENLPLLQDKLPASGTLIYVCSNKICKLPVESVEKALNQITRGREQYSEDRK